ncbi:unnamed protein product [Musa banksii]
MSFFIAWRQLSHVPFDGNGSSGPLFCQPGFSRSLNVCSHEPLCLKVIVI